MDDRDLYWMAGLLEGEGCFTWAPLRGGSGRKTPLIQLVINDYDVAKRYADLVGNSVGIKTRKSPRKGGYRVRTTGRPAVNLMGLLRPHMGGRRRSRIDGIVAEYCGEAGVRAVENKR